MSVTGYEISIMYSDFLLLNHLISSNINMHVEGQV